MWEIQHFTLCDGWVNTWTEDDTPIRFPTLEHARQALWDYYGEMRDAGLATMYDPADFRVVEVK